MLECSEHFITCGTSLNVDLFLKCQRIYHFAQPYIGETIFNCSRLHSILYSIQHMYFIESDFFPVKRFFFQVKRNKIP